MKKKIFAALLAILIVCGMCFVFVGCGTDTKKETIKYREEYSYSYQYEEKVSIENNVIISSPQGNITIYYTIIKSFIFYGDRTYKFIDIITEKSIITDKETTKFGYGTYEILSDNYLYFTQYSYNDETIPIPITHRFKIEDKNTLIFDDENKTIYTLAN